MSGPAYPLAHDVDVTGNLLMRVSVVNVVIANHRLAELIGDPDDVSDDVCHSGFRKRTTRFDQRAVAVQRLDLDIVIELHALFQSLIGTVKSHFKQFTVHVGGTNQNVFPSLLDLLADDARFGYDVAVSLLGILLGKVGQIVGMRK